MTHLLLVRHGETDWNRDHRWQGHSDTPLNERGRAQARAVAETIEGVERIYTSDLARARETAEIIGARLGLPVHVDARLRERGFGGWEGLTTAEIEAQDPRGFARWRAGEGAGAADAEQVAEFAERVAAFVADVLTRHPAGDVLVVAHGGTIRAIHAAAAGLDYVRDHREIPAVANCVVSRYAAQEGKLAPID